MIGSRKERVICVINSDKHDYSETFVRAHLKHLPEQVKYLYGGYFPRYRDDNIPLLSDGRLQSFTRPVLRRVLGLPDEYFQKAALIRYLLSSKADAVIAENGPVGVAVMDVCTDADVPLLVYFRGADAYSSHILEQVGQHYTSLFENAVAIIAVSRELENHLQFTLGAPREKLHYIPSGVDATLFHGADPGQTPPVFLTVGRFVDKKAPHLTILAFNKVVKNVPEARLIMMGDGPLWEACKQLVCGLDIDDAVEFTGPRAHTEVATAMRHARALVQHSITASYGDSEGTPNAIKEAGAASLPVISTRHGGIPEIVIDGRTGYLGEEGDVEGMADHMLRLAKDPALAARLGRAAREWICAEFSMEKSIRKLSMIIDASIHENSDYQLSVPNG